MLDKLKDECGVFGIYGHAESAKLAYLGLYALQHRGQESGGIAASDGGQLRAGRGMGYVADIFGEQALAELQGYAFSSTTGTVAWFANLSQYDRWTPAVDADYVYAYTGYMGLSILSRTTGSLVSRISDTSFNWNGYSINGSPVIGTGGSILCVIGRNVNYGNRLVSFSTTTVNSSIPGYFPSNPALANGVIYLTNETPYQLEARSEATGALLWSWAPTGAGEVDFYGNVVATDNLVFLSTNRRIYAIDRTTHLPVWSYNKPGDLAISDSGVLYITLYSSGTPTNISYRVRSYRP